MRGKAGSCRGGFNEILRLPTDMLVKPGAGAENSLRGMLCRSSDPPLQYRVPRSSSPAYVGETRSMSLPYFVRTER